MKIISIFSKTPQHKKFSYTPRFYDPLEEERRQREERIRQELEARQQKEKEESAKAEISLPPAAAGYRDRIQGSFRTAKKTANVQADPSANMLRLIILLILAVGLIGFIQFGFIALYAVAFIFVPFYFYLKFRRPQKK